MAPGLQFLFSFAHRSISDQIRGCMEIAQHGEERFYDGLPSVTTVLDVINEPHLARWRGRIGNEEADRITNEAAWIGDLVHDVLSAVELTGANLEEYQNPAIIHPIGAYIEWKRQTLDRWLMIEEALISKEHGFGGRIDRVGMLKGDSLPSIVDLKSGRPSIKHKFQTAGYKLLLKSNGVVVGRRLCLYLPTTEEKGSKVTVKEFTNPNDEAGFLYCLKLWNIIKE